MICLTAGLFGLTLLTTTFQSKPIQPTYFVFLVTGKNAPTATPEEIGQYQTAHLQNFKRLFEEGKLATAGPMADPDKSKRGIVVLSVEKKSMIPGLFASDPYIAKGFMEVEALPMKVEFGKINTSSIDPNGIEENRIVVFTAGAVNPDTASTRSAKIRHLEHVRNGGKKAGLAFYASLSASPDMRAVALFKGKNDKAISDWLKKDPLIKSGVLKATKMRQWLSKGVL